MGVWGASRPPISSNLQESWSKASHAARELVTVCSVTYFLLTIVGQLVKTPPPQQKVSRYITGHHHDLTMLTLTFLYTTRSK